MAKPAWLTTNKNNGSGNDTVSVSSSAPHTGRNARLGDLTFRATNVTDKVVAITQNGKPEFVTIESAKAVPQAGGSITITGKSNSSKLTFSLGSGTLTITIPTSYTANSLSTNNGASIAGDPGANQEYDFSITIPSIASNGGSSEKTRQLIATTNNSQTAICAITQAASAPSLSVSPVTITLDWEGTAQTVTVTSNTSWEII